MAHTPIQTQKGKSPFYPGQPVPVEYFVGRRAEIQRILERGVGQVAAGKPSAFFVQGEYGIGKSSIAGYAQSVAERENGLHAIYATLGAVETMDGVGAAILEATVRSGILRPKQRMEVIRHWLSKYIGEQSLFGVTLRADKLKEDAPKISSGILPFLCEVLEKLKDDGVKGIFLVLDEINGITRDPKFAHFLKGLVDTNAMGSRPLPLLLMLCGVEERRREMIRHHQPIDRIFDVVQIDKMTREEMDGFFLKTFGSIHVQVEEAALHFMSHYSAGFPKIMHLVGDSAFWCDQDGVIDIADATKAVVDAAHEVGRKYVDQQVYAALQSKDYRAILDEVAEHGISFKKNEIANKLNDSQKKKFNNFLQKMKRLHVLRAGENRGEYVFNLRMVHLYLWLNRSAKRATTRTRIPGTIIPSTAPR